MCRHLEHFLAARVLCVMLLLTLSHFLCLGFYCKPFLCFRHSSAAAAVLFLRAMYIACSFVVKSCQNSVICKAFCWSSISCLLSSPPNKIMRSTVFVILHIIIIELLCHKIIIIIISGAPGHHYTRSIIIVHKCITTSRWSGNSRQMRSLFQHRSCTICVCWQVLLGSVLTDV